MWTLRFRRLKSPLAALALASASTLAQTPTDLRVALVIGNAAYRHAPALANPGNDARAIGVALRKLGFRVYDVIDGDKAAMTQAISSLEAQVRNRQAVAVLYYAGHGLQLDWRNYMVPVDADLRQADDVPKQTVDVEQVIRAFKEAKTRLNVIVLDACRDNPFSSASGSKGLAQLDAPPGTYLAFATAPGNVAEDGDEASGNGLYTQFLVKELQRPASIESMFKRVRLQVRMKSQGRQIPWDSTSLEEDFAFNDGKRYTLTPQDFQAEIQRAKQLEERLRREAEEAAARERALQLQREAERLKLAEAQKLQEEAARRKAEAAALERERELVRLAEQERLKAVAAAQALERARAEEAQRLKDLELARVQEVERQERARLSAEQAKEAQFAQEKADWDRIKDSRRAQDFYEFLLKYPTGLISQQATFALERLDKAKVTTQANREGQVQIPGQDRFRAGEEWTQLTRYLIGRRRVPENLQTYKVDRIEEGLVYISSGDETGITTLDGAVIKTVGLGSGSVFTYDPPISNIPAGEISVGARWETATMETVRNRRPKPTLIRTSSFQVVAYERISVPAGSFWTFRLEERADKENSEHFYNIRWFAPSIGKVVKFEQFVHHQWAQGPLLTHRLTEMQSYRPPAP